MTIVGIANRIVSSMKIIKFISGTSIFSTQQIQISHSVLLTAPAKILDLIVVNVGSLDSLKVSWKRPPGNLDFYNVTLTHLGSVKGRKTLQPQVTETYFDKLISGSLYQVAVSTISGELSAEMTGYGRTGMFVFWVSIHQKQFDPLALLLFL